MERAGLSAGTPEDSAAFIETTIAEAGDDPALLPAALGDVARSRGMARDAGLSRGGVPPPVVQVGE